VINNHVLHRQARAAILPWSTLRSFSITFGVVLGTMLGHPSLAAEKAIQGGAAPSSIALEQPAEQSTANPLWEIGGFALAVSQQAYPGSDQQVDRVLPLPFVIYRGKFLRADRETTGLRAIRTPRYELDVGASGSFAARSSEIEARSGMPELGTLIEFGPRLRVNLSEGSGSGRWRLDLPLRGVFDLSDGGAYRGVAFEPRLLWQQRLSPQFAYAASVGAIVGDKKLGHTFYGVDKAYAIANRPAYTAEGGLIAWRLSTSINYSLTPQWRIFGFGRVDSVSGATNQDSPLVRQTTGLSAGVGVFYTWLRSTRSAED
jgi:outer membrane protein